MGDVKEYLVRDAAGEYDLMVVHAESAFQAARIAGQHMPNLNQIQVFLLPIVMIYDRVVEWVEEDN